MLCEREREVYIDRREREVGRKGEQGAPTQVHQITLYFSRKRLIAHTSYVGGSNDFTTQTPLTNSYFLYLCNHFLDHMRVACLLIKFQS